MGRECEFESILGNGDHCDHLGAWLLPCVCCVLLGVEPRPSALPLSYIPCLIYSYFQYFLMLHSWVVNSEVQPFY